MVMPIYDDNPFRLPHRPIMTWGLIATNMIIYFGEVTADSPQAVIRTFGLTPAALIGGEPGPVHRHTCQPKLTQAGQ